MAILWVDVGKEWWLLYTHLVIAVLCNYNALLMSDTPLYPADFFLSLFQEGFTIINEERDKTNECFYLFEMDSSVACPVEESHLSVGSILLIV